MTTRWVLVAVLLSDIMGLTVGNRKEESLEDVDVVE